MPTRSQLRRPFQRARTVDPRPITGRETPHDLLQHAFGAYVGRQERTAYELMRRSMREDCSIFLTLSGAMTPRAFTRAASSRSSSAAWSPR